MRRLLHIIFGLLPLAVLGQTIPLPQVQPAVSSTIAAAGRRDSIDLTIQAPSSAAVFQLPHRVVYHYPAAQVWVVRFKAKDVSQKHLNSGFIDLAKKPVEELTTGSMNIALNGLAAAHRYYPQLKGNGIRISIKEQAFDTSDIDLKNRYSHSGTAAATVSQHATIIATIAAGGGNSSAQATGAAPAAMVGSESFASLLPGIDSIFKSNGLFVQNHSYGTVVENYYGAEASAFDAQAGAVPQLLHVFSAGNSGTAAGAGPYTTVQGMANITGNFKLAKNVLTIGAVDSLGSLLPFSSRGPAFDGRIKPEIVAYGEDGASGAAALVSGTAALLQQAYRQKWDSLPTASLLKAVLINSADDIGIAGIDHSSGWGNLNALAAVQTIFDGRTTTKTIRQGTSENFSFTLPAAAKRLRITVSWADPFVPAGSVKALMNDVDVVLQHGGNGTTWQPWVLSHHPDSLFAPARRDVDTVNNTEQITVDDAPAGVYQLVLNGSKLQTLEQIVSIAWQADGRDSFLFTYPLQTTAVESGTQKIIRWQTAKSDTATLEYTINNSPWLAIASVDAAGKYALWQVPTEAGVAQLRMRFTNGTTVFSDSFVVSAATAVTVNLICGDSVLLSWNGVAGATGYQLYRLGATYLEPLQQVQDSFIVLKRAGAISDVYAVAPLLNNSIGVRSSSLRPAATGVGCYFKAFFEAAQNGRQVQLRGELGTLYGVSFIRFQKSLNGDFKTLHTVAPQLSFGIRDSALVQGLNEYRLQAVLANGQIVNSEPVSVYYFSLLPVQAFPNPVVRNGTFTLLTQLPGRYQSQMLDSWGRPLQTMPLQNLFTPLKAPPSSGIYLIRIWDGKKVVGTFKVLVL